MPGVRPQHLALLFAVAFGLAATAAPAQQLENKTSQATSGTTGHRTEGHLSGANLSDGGQGPASETKMPPKTKTTDGRAGWADKVGSPQAVKELFQH